MSPVTVFVVRAIAAFLGAYFINYAFLGYVTLLNVVLFAAFMVFVAYVFEALRRRRK